MEQVKYVAGQGRTTRRSINKWDSSGGVIACSHFALPPQRSFHCFTVSIFLSFSVRPALPLPLTDVLVRSLTSGNKLLSQKRNLTLTDNFPLYPFHPCSSPLLLFLNTADSALSERIKLAPLSRGWTY